MNGGNKMYIGRDGFADVYSATPAEEAEWAKEVTNAALAKVDAEENATTLEHAFDNLVFHKYPALDELLLNKMKDTSAARQTVFAICLWNIGYFKKGFEIIFEILLTHKPGYLNEVFVGQRDFKQHEAARQFLVYCLESEDDDLVEKAQRTLSIWAWSGVPALRKDRLLETLQPEYKDLPSYKAAVEEIKEILRIKN